jgi:hypothetical protein
MQFRTSKHQNENDRRPRRVRSFVLLAAIGSAVVAYLIAATAVAAGSPRTVQKGATSHATKTWNGRNGAEYADQTRCPSTGGAYWLFILTPGGNKLASGTLSVTFKSGAGEVSTGYFPGNGNGSLHFDVTSAHPDAIKSAVASFAYTGSSPNRIVLTISHAYCTGGGSSSSSSAPVTQPVTQPVTGTNTP